MVDKGKLEEGMAQENIREHQEQGINYQHAQV